MLTPLQADLRLGCAPVLWHKHCCFWCRCLLTLHAASLSEWASAASQAWMPCVAHRAAIKWPDQPSWLAAGLGLLAVVCERAC